MSKNIAYSFQVNFGGKKAIYGQSPETVVLGNSNSEMGIFSLAEFSLLSRMIYFFFLFFLNK